MTEWQRELLRTARTHVEARVLGRPATFAPAGAATCPPASGAFVTLHVDGELRGCLGTLDAREPLPVAVARLAADVSHLDRRFDAIRPEELGRLEVEISVLSQSERVYDATTIEVGRHGLIVEHGYARGLLLPQVPAEHGWGREQFLEHTCIKAGLPRDAWRRGATLYRFEAMVFSERSAPGETASG